MRRITNLFFFLFYCGIVCSQSIFTNSITGTNPNTSNPYKDGQVVDPNMTASGIGRGNGLSGSNANNRYNASGWTTATSADDNDYFEFTLTPATGYKINFLRFVFTGQASASGPILFSLKSSIDGYVSEIGSLSATGSTTDLSHALFQNIETAVSFRIFGWGGSSASGTFSINDFAFEGSVVAISNTSPDINITSSLTPFQSIYDQPSVYQSYSVSGSNLSGDINISAPAGYEVSLANDNGYSALLMLSATAGSVSPTTVYIRQKSSVYGNNNGQIQHSSPGAKPNIINISGIVYASEPLTPSSLSFSNISANSIQINVTPGNGTGRIVIMKAGSIVTGIPGDGINYSASPIFGQGQTIAEGEFIIYSGTGNTIMVTGLQPLTNYFVTVFEFNDVNVAEAINYAGNSVSAIQITGAGLSGLQLSAMNTAFLIDFDQTAYETNNGQFNATGFSTSPGPGQLSSGAWSVTGWSDGNMDFDEVRTTGDFARGLTNSHPSTGGIYAFEPLTTGNRALGFQPGTNDWAPGSISLRIQNQTGVTLHTLAIAYKLLVFNNADRSSSFNISYSTDNLNYTSIPILDHSSPALADPSAAWIMHDKTAEITGFAIPSGQYIYLRWSSADVSGTGSRDELALDDISIIGNPVSEGPLPVRFTTLKAFQKDNGIRLEFTNAVEENLEEYVIERSFNGNQFIPLVSMVPSKNDGELASYHILDTHPYKGNNFYRIKSVETNGTISYSSILRISTSSASPDILIYPNPVKGDNLTIQISEIPAGRYDLNIYDAVGGLVMKRSVNHEGGAITQNLTVSHLHPGWYSVQIRGEVVLRSQFIKW